MTRPGFRLRRPVTRDDSWLQPILENSSLPADALSFLVQNEPMILEIGKAAFQGFVSSVSSGQTQAAIDNVIATADFHDLAVFMGNVASAEQLTNQTRADLEKLAESFLSTVATASISVLAALLKAGVIPI